LNIVTPIPLTQLACFQYQTEFFFFVAYCT